MRQTKSHNPASVVSIQGKQLLRTTVNVAPDPKIARLSADWNVFVSDWFKLGSEFRLEPILHDKSAYRTVLQRTVIGHQRSLVLDSGTRDHQIKVALLPTDAFQLGTLCGIPSNDGKAQREHRKGFGHLLDACAVLLLANRLLGDLSAADAVSEARIAPARRLGLGSRRGWRGGCALSARLEITEGPGSLLLLERRML
ncbi:MAG TPA: hypothetical protein VGC79_26625 [Polyangiaceae bacterium]